MRILVYGDIGGSGGYIRYCKGLFGSNFTPNDVELYLICSSRLRDILLPLDEKIKIITHPWIDSNNRIKRYLWYLFIFPKLVNKIKPQIEFYPLGRLRNYFRKVKTVVTCHNLLLFDNEEMDRITNVNEKKYYRTYKNNQHRSITLSSGVIFLSDYSRDIVCSEIKNVSTNTVIAHGLDPIFQLPPRDTYEFGEKINVLYVSPIYHYKHQIEVVKAIKIVRELTSLNIHIRLIGGGNASDIIELQKIVQSENLSNYVQLVGTVDYKKLIDEYKTADLFVFASSCETFGITILEAMGARLPIACSNKTGLSGILKDAGVYFNPMETESIANSIIELLKSPEKRKYFGEKAFRSSFDFTWEKCAEQTFSFLSDVIEQKNK